MIILIINLGLGQVGEAVLRLFCEVKYDYKFDFIKSSNNQL